MIKKKQYAVVGLLMLPALSLYGFFLLNPIIQSIYMSFFSWNGIKSVPMKFVGIGNYEAIFSNPRFLKAFINSGWFMVGGFVLLMPLAFVLALIIVSNLKGTKFFKAAYFIPVVLPITAVGLVWTYMLYPDGGVVNSLIRFIGYNGAIPNWLGNPQTAIFTTIFVNEWIYAGFNMLIFAAGMVAIPEEVFEAATIDGANGLQRIFYIMVPLMKESFKVFAVLCVTGCMRTFDLVFVMTGGGPAHSTE
ncbi:MAG: sugar ABC transporter permease, partial [Vallitaleaceae bacterium]|nr:sugar ABC transporter permease [Vallitaleaceae bacterium]